MAAPLLGFLAGLFSRQAIATVVRTLGSRAAAGTFGRSMLRRGMSGIFGRKAAKRFARDAAGRFVKQSEADAGSAALHRLSRAEAANKLGRFGDVMAGKAGAAEDVAAAQSSSAEEESRAKLQDAKRDLINNLGKISFGLVGMHVALVKTPGILEKFASGLLESSAALGQYNASIAADQARMRAADIRRDVQLGLRTQGTHRAASGAVNELRDAMMPLRETATDLKNLGAFFAAKVGVAFTRFIEIHYSIQLIRKGIEKLAQLVEDQKDKQGDAIPGEQLILDFALGRFKDKENEKQNQPRQQPERNRRM